MNNHRFRFDRERGNALVLAMFILLVLSVLTLAEFSVLQKNQASSTHFNNLLDLRNCAENGVVLSFYDTKTNASGTEGNFGLGAWTTLDDLGKDGVAGTSDEGEGDGIPTPGEPNTNPVSIGRTALGASMVVQVSDLGGGLRKISSTVVNESGIATVEKVLRLKVPTIPKVAALLVDPNVVLDFRGNAFSIDGHDTNLDGSAGSGESKFGIGTITGDIEGENAATLLSQVPPNAYDQITGVGSDPSVGEVDSETVDFAELFNSLKSSKNYDLAAGTHTDLDLESSAGLALPIAYSEGDVRLAGSGVGKGVMVVEGDLVITGDFTFEGLLVVNGDVRLSGGGASIQVFGSLVVTDSLIAVDEANEFDISGTADVRYSEAALDAITTSYQSSGGQYIPVYHNE